MMTYKEAKAYLQPIADNATLTGYREALCKAIEALEMAESVVRCKDCKHYEITCCGYMCKRWDEWLPTVDDDFCSYGERRVDNG